MPYVITTRQALAPGLDPDGGGPLQLVSRRAVATLDEARIAVTTWITDRWSSHPRFARADGDLYRPETRAMVTQGDTLPESGGTVGPLPNGTVIEAKLATWEDLADDLARAIGPQRHALMREAQNGNSDRLIAAFNAAQKACA